MAARKVLWNTILFISTLIVSSFIVWTAFIHSVPCIVVFSHLVINICENVLGAESRFGHHDILIPPW